MDIGMYLQSTKEENSSAAVYNNKNICEAYSASVLVLKEEKVTTTLFQYFFF